MKKSSKLVLNRDYTMTTNKGHVICFVKDVPTHVPPVVYNEAIAIGALPADGKNADVIEDDRKDQTPIDPADRAPLILMAIEALFERNEREDFTAAGAPTVDAVSKEVDFKVSAKEIAASLQVYHNTKAGVE